MMSLRSKVLHAISWSAAAQISNTLAAFVVTVILARLLTPHDFGVVSMAIAVQAVLASLVDFGFSQLIIRTQNLPDRQLSGLFIARLFVGVLQGLAMYLLAPAIAGLMEHQELSPVVQWLSILSPLGSLTMVPEALMRKRLDFKRLAISNVSATVVSGGLGIGLALSGFGLWSLVSQYLSSVIVNAMILSFLCEWRLVKSPDFSALRHHFNFISNSYGLNIVGALALQGDKLVLGQLLGASALGLYVRGFGLAQQVQGFAVSIAEQVGFAALSQSNHDIEQTRKRFLSITNAIGRVTAPVMFMIAVLADPIVRMLYGPQWVSSIPILSLASLALFVNAINLPWDFLMRALGRVDVLFRWSLLDGSTRLAGVALGAVLGGAIGAATGYMLMAIVWFCIRGVVMGKASGIPAGRFIALFFQSITLGGISALSAYLGMVAGDGLPDYLRIVYGGALGGLTYVSLVWIWGKDNVPI